MRIVLLANRDIESALALNLLLRKMHAQVMAIYLSDHVGGAQPRPASMLDPLTFIEQDLFNMLAFPLLEQRGSSTPRWLGFPALSQHYRIPLHPVHRLKDAAVLDSLRATQADIFVSIRFGKILPDEVINIPAHGVLNLHSGLLPQYRGVLATLRALLHGDREIGCTLHRIDSPGIDLGGIVASARRAVDPTHSLLWHILALYPLGVELITQALDSLAQRQTLALTPQNPANGAYYSFPEEAELQRFASLGWHLFDREDIRQLLIAFGVEPSSIAAHDLEHYLR
jgi:methionyl-tRNA formyltransferase